MVLPNENGIDGSKTVYWKLNCFANNIATFERANKFIQLVAKMLTLIN
jgi:hypothetical protein